MPLAILGKPVGLHGEILIRWLTDVEENLAPGRLVYVGPARRGHRVEVLNAGSRPSLKLSSIDSRDAATLLRGSVISVPLAEAVPPPSGRFYPCEIIGARVTDERGGDLGTVREIMETGGNDVYRVVGPAGEVLIPAIADVVRGFDADRGVLRVELVAGLR